MVAGRTQKGRKRPAGAAKVAPAPKPMSLRAYARHRKAAGLVGGNLQAVQQARDAKRITLTADGRIADAARADAEWAANTRAERVPLTGPTAPGGEEPIDFGEARARLEAAKAQLAELELAEKRAELVAVKEVDARMVGEYARAKTKLLAVPSKMRQRDPAFTLEQIALLEALIRETLNDLASDEDAPARAAEAT